MLQQQPRGSVASIGSTTVPPPRPPPPRPISTAVATAATPTGPAARPSGQPVALPGHGMLFMNFVDILCFLKI